MATNPEGQVTPVNIGALSALARGNPERLRGVLCSHDVRNRVGLTGTNVHVSWLASDGSGSPLTHDLAAVLADSVVDYCTPRTRIQEARRLDLESGENREITRLAREAFARFTKQESSGEGGEILLYFLMELGLGIPQILSKMSLKTSNDMHVHGVDGVYALPVDDRGLAVYWGESKLYRSFSDAMSQCLASIGPYLTDPWSPDRNEDMLLVRDNLDVGDRMLAIEIAEYFRSGTVQRQSIEVRGACVIGFDEADYPKLGAEALAEASTELADRVDKWVKTIGRKIGAAQLEHVEIEFFCLPIPSVALFRQAFQQAIGH